MRCEKVFSINDIEMGVPPKVVNRVLALSDILIFCTGLRYLTHAEEYEVIFDHSNIAEKARLLANTCNDGITFPVNDHYLDEDTFSKNVTRDILDGGMV